jgi:hypothetical protein
MGTAWSKALVAPSVACTLTVPPASADFSSVDVYDGQDYVVDKPNSPHGYPLGTR